MERIQSLIFNPMQERSAVSDALLPSRNVGVVWNGSNPERRSSWGFGVFNDWYDSDKDFNNSDSQVISRIAWAPLSSEDGSNLLHIGFGYRYSDAKEGFRYRTTPEFNKSPIFVDTGLHAADKTETNNIELYWRRGPLMLGSEFTRTEVSNPAIGNPSFDGYFVTASWALTGEMRPYNIKNGVFGSLPVARSVYQHGKGAWELSARYSKLDLNDGQISGGELEVSSLGIHWWLTPFFGIDLNFRHIRNELEGVKGTSKGVNARVVLSLD